MSSCAAPRRHLCRHVVEQETRAPSNCADPASRRVSSRQHLLPSCDNPRLFDVDPPVTTELGYPAPTAVSNRCLQVRAAKRASFRFILAVIHSGLFARLWRVVEACQRMKPANFVKGNFKFNET